MHTALLTVSLSLPFSPLCLPLPLSLSPCFKVLIMALLIHYCKNFNSKAKLIFWNAGKKKHRIKFIVKKNSFYVIFRCENSLKNWMVLHNKNEKRSKLGIQNLNNCFPLCSDSTSTTVPALLCTADHLKQICKTITKLRL